MTKFLMRSLMFVPGDNEKFMQKASDSIADVLLLDLEDSVQSITNKQKARDLIFRMVREKNFKNHHVFPRVNDRESGQLLKDIYQLTIEGIDGFMYPKAKTENDIYFFDKLLETIEYEKGFTIGTFKIIPLIETSGAVLNAQAICKISKRVVAIAFGSEDYIASIEGVHDKDSLSLATPRAIIAMAARDNGVLPIDTVHINVHDLDDLEKNILYAKKLGFEGMLVLHPKELSIVHKYYSPSKNEVANANELLKLAEMARLENRGVALMHGKFIGPPLILSARKIIEKNKQVIEKNKKLYNKNS